MCVHMCMCVVCVINLFVCRFLWVWMCVHVYACLPMPEENVAHCPQMPYVFSRQAYHWDVDLINLARLFGQLILGIMCLFLSSVGIAIVQQHMVFKSSRERTRVLFIAQEALY